MTFRRFPSYGLVHGLSPAETGHNLGVGFELQIGPTCIPPPMRTGRDLDPPATARSPGAALLPRNRPCRFRRAESWQITHPTDGIPQRHPAYAPLPSLVFQDVPNRFLLGFADQDIGRVAGQARTKANGEGSVVIADSTRQAAEARCPPAMPPVPNEYDHAGTTHDQPMDRASGALDATAELASVERCSEPERRPSGSIVHATTLLASVERCSTPRAAVPRATPPDSRY